MYLLYKMSNITEAFKLLGIADPTALSVNLPIIYQKLILSNFEYAKANVNNPVMIINLCEQPLQSNSNNSLIYNFKLDDSDSIPYHYFKGIMVQCAHLIKMAVDNKYPVIVNCAAGINRSSSAVVAYSILARKLKVDDAIGYIKHMKAQKYGNRWPTLTNYKFVEYLKRMESELVN